MLRVAAAAALALLVAGCGGSTHPAAGKTPVAYRDRGDVAAIAAARASNPRLFAIFPRRPGRRSCDIPIATGLVTRSLHGTCRTRITHPVTHGRWAVAFVTFREEWRRTHHSSWTLIVRLPAEKVVATQRHGQVSPQAWGISTDGVAAGHGLLGGEVEVVAYPGGEVRICAGGATLDLLRDGPPRPPVCVNGLRAVGVRVGALPDRSRKPRARWGYLYLTGLDRDGVFYVSSQRRRAPRTRGVPFLPTPPCPAPAGGWRPLASNYEQEKAIAAYRHRHPGEITSIAYFDHGGIGVVTSTQPSRTRATLGSEWPGQVCVVKARYSPAVIHRVQRRMLRLLFDRAVAARYGWISGAGGYSENNAGQPTTPIEVLLVTPQLRALLRRQPPGLVAVDAVLQPLRRG